MRWYAYFREAVADNSNEADWRVRRVVVHNYLVDDTLDVSEPWQNDSGLMQVRCCARAGI